MSHPHDYIEKCPYCGRFMTYAQIQHHVCNSRLINVEEIRVLYYFLTKEQNGDTLIMARGINGTLYRLRQTNKTLDQASSDEFLHGTRNRRRVDRILKNYLLETLTSLTSSPVSA